MVSWLGSATFVVTLTWWVGLFVWAAISGSLPDEVIAPIALTASFSLAGLLCGVVGAIAWVGIDRQERRKDLQGTDVRGLTSSIGEVPFLMKPPPEAANLPDLRCRDVEPGFYVRWLAKHQKAHPKHAALVRRLLRILAAHKRLPASHTGDRHGGRTLLEHSLLCGSLMHELAQSYEYDGTVTRSGGRVKLGLRDPSYRFDKHDPMCLVIGLAHDFGKIEAFQYNEDGQVIGTGREHDSTGARIVSRLEECWDLPDADRFAMTMAIAHYHHPVELPLAPDRRAIDDRTIALMELLVYTDTVASAVEHEGKRLTKDEVESRLTEAESRDVRDRSKEFFDHFVQELHNPTSFNLTTNEGGRNLGWYASVVGSNRPLLLVNEGNMLAAVARRAEVDPKLYAGDGRSLITIELLKQLSGRCELITSLKVGGADQVLQMPAESALWHVEFSKKTSTGFVRQFGPVVCYVLEPTLFPDLVKKMGVAASRAEILGPVMGTGRAIRTTKQTPKPCPTGQARAQAAGEPAVSQPHSSEQGPEQAAKPAATTLTGQRDADAALPLSQPSAAAGPGAGKALELGQGNVQPAEPAQATRVAVAPSPTHPSSIAPADEHSLVNYEPERTIDQQQRGRISDSAERDSSSRKEALGAPMTGLAGPVRKTSNSAIGRRDATRMPRGPDEKPARSNQHTSDRVAPPPRDGGTRATATVEPTFLPQVSNAAMPAHGCADDGMGGDKTTRAATATNVAVEAAKSSVEQHGVEAAVETNVEASPGSSNMKVGELQQQRPFSSASGKWPPATGGGTDALDDEDLGIEIDSKSGGEEGPSPPDERQLSLGGLDPKPSADFEVAHQEAGKDQVEAHEHDEHDQVGQTCEQLEPAHPVNLAQPADLQAAPVPVDLSQERTLDSPRQTAPEYAAEYPPEYFEIWALAGVNRLGTQVVARSEFKAGIAKIALTFEELIRLVPEVDWQSCRVNITLHQRNGRFKTIEVLSGTTAFTIIVSIELHHTEPASMNRTGFRGGLLA
jgi:hypothetical protein